MVMRHKIPATNNTIAPWTLSAVFTMYDAGTPSSDISNMLTEAFTEDDIFQYQSNVIYTTWSNKTIRMYLHTTQYNTIRDLQSAHVTNRNKLWIRSTGWPWTMPFHAAISYKEKYALKLRLKWVKRVNRTQVRFEWVPYSRDRYREGATGAT